LLGEDDRPLQRRGAPAVLAWPLDADPAASGERALPRALEAAPLDVVLGRRRRRQVRCEPPAQLGAERFVRRGVAEVEHRPPGRDYSKATTSGKERGLGCALSLSRDAMGELRFPADGGCFGCSATHPDGLRLSFDRDGEAIVCRYTIPDRFHGAPGIAHGGIVATILDDVSCA